MQSRIRIRIISSVTNIQQMAIPLMHLDLLSLLNTQPIKQIPLCHKQYHTRMFLPACVFPNLLLQFVDVLQKLAFISPVTLYCKMMEFFSLLAQRSHSQPKFSKELRRSINESNSFKAKITKWSILAFDSKGRSKLVYYLSTRLHLANNKQSLYYLFTSWILVYAPQLLG